MRSRSCHRFPEFGSSGTWHRRICPRPKDKCRDAPGIARLEDLLSTLVRLRESLPRCVQVAVDGRYSEDVLLWARMVRESLPIGIAVPTPPSRDRGTRKLWPGRCTLLEGRD